MWIFSCLPGISVCLIYISGFLSERIALGITGFSVLMGEGEFRSLLCCHLDWNAEASFDRNFKVRVLDIVCMIHNWYSILFPAPARSVPL